MYRPRRGPRPATGETYPILDVFAAACAVYRLYGFVKRREGYTDRFNKRVDDSYTLVMNILRCDNQCGTVADEDRQDAEDLHRFFSEKMVLFRLADEMTDYNSRLNKILQKDNVNANSDIGMISSLPNSRDITYKRQELTDKFEKLQSRSEFIGKPKERMEIEANVLDVKFLSKSHSYVVTAVTEDENISKFFVESATADSCNLSPMIKNKTIRFVGTVRLQELNTYTNCKETIFNRVKIK